MCRVVFTCCVVCWVNIDCVCYWKGVDRSSRKTIGQQNQHKKDQESNQQENHEDCMCCCRSAESLLSFPAGVAGLWGVGAAGRPTSGCKCLSPFYSLCSYLNFLKSFKYCICVFMTNCKQTKWPLVVSSGSRDMVLCSCGFILLLGNNSAEYLRVSKFSTWYYLNDQITHLRHELNSQDVNILIYFQQSWN